MEKQIKVIGDRTFSFGIMPAMEALKVEVSIARVIGEPLFKAMVDDTQKKPIGEQKKLSKEERKEQLMAAGVQAIGQLTSKLDPEELSRIVEQCMRTVSVQHGTKEPERVNIDKHFTGKPRELWAVFIESLKVNFNDFFTGNLLDSLQDQLKELS